METTLEMPDGRQVTIEHDGELTDEGVKKVAAQLGYDVPGEHRTARNITAEGIRLAGSIGGAVLGSRFGKAGASLGGAAGSAMAAPLANLVAEDKNSIGSDVADVGLSAFQPASKALALGERLVRGAKIGAGLAVAHDVARTAIDEQKLPSLSSLGTDVLAGAAIGAPLEGLLGMRPKATQAPAVPPPATNEGSITAALDKRKPSSLAQANAEANEIITGKSKTPLTTAQLNEDASAQATPSPTPGAQVGAAQIAFSKLKQAEDELAMLKELKAGQDKINDAEARVREAQDAADELGKLRGDETNKTPAKRASVDDDNAIDAALGTKVGEESGLTKEAEDKLLAEQQKAIDAIRAKNNPKETIASAAVKFSDGEIKTGKTHAEIIDSIQTEEPTIDKIRNILTDLYKGNGNTTYAKVAPLLGVTEKQISKYFSKKSLVEGGGFEEAAQHFLELAKKKAKDLRGSDDGFVTSTGRYVDREEGMKIAESANQTTPKPDYVVRRNLLAEHLKEPSEKALYAEHLDPTISALPKKLTAEFSGIQDGIPGNPKYPDKELWTINQAIPGHNAGSTVYRETAEAAGIKLPKVTKKMKEEAILATEKAQKQADEALAQANEQNAPKAAKSPEKAIVEPPVTPPEKPLANLGEPAPTKVRQLAQRVINSETIPEETRSAVAADPTINYETHAHGVWADKAQVANETELRDLIKNAKTPDEQVIYKSELANRMTAAKRHDEAGALFAEIAQHATPGGQVLAATRAVKTAVGQLNEVEQAVAKAGRNLTKQQKEKVLELASNEIKLNRERAIAEKRAQEFPSKENYEAFRKAESEHGDAQVAFDEYSADVAPRNLPDMLVKMVQGNLLTPLSLASNIFGNLIWSPVKKTAMSIASVMDFMVTGGIKALAIAAGKDPSQVKRSIIATNPLPSIMELHAMADGVRTAAKEILTGPSKDSYIKAEVQRGFRPLRSLIDSFTGENLARGENGEVKIWDRTKAFIEGTLGAPPELMFRLLSVGDKPFRRAATVRALLEQAELRGIKGKDLEHFMAFPDAKTKEFVDKATRNAIFAEENAGITTLNRFLDSDMAKLLRVDKIPILAGALKVFGRLTVPFRQFPVNYALTAMNFAVPGLALSKAAYYGYKTGAVMRARGIGGEQAAKTILEYRRKSLQNLGEAALGVMMYSAAEILWDKGLISESPADTSAKRSDQAEAMGASKINVSGLERYLNGGDPTQKHGDTLKDWTRLGIPAVIFHIYTQRQAKERDKAGKLGELPEKSSIFDHPLQKTISALPGMGSFIFDQTFLAGTSALLEAVKDADPDSPKFQNWMNNMFKAVTAIPMPNTVDAVARARMQYVPELRGNSETETLSNIWQHKIMGLPADMRGLVLKEDTWGRPIPRTPNGANPYVYGLIDVLKSGELGGDKHDDALRALYKKTNRDSIWPDPVSSSIVYQGDSHELDQEDAQKLRETIGSLRRERMEKFVDSHVWERLSPNDRVLGLEGIYQGANEDGRKKFTTSSGIYQKYFSSNPDKKTTTSRSSESLKRDLFKESHKN